MSTSPTSSSRSSVSGLLAMQASSESTSEASFSNSSGLVFTTASSRLPTAKFSVAPNTPPSPSMVLGSFCIGASVATSPGSSLIDSLSDFSSSFSSSFSTAPLASFAGLCVAMSYSCVSQCNCSSSPTPFIPFSPVPKLSSNFTSTLASAMSSSVSTSSDLTMVVTGKACVWASPLSPTLSQSLVRSTVVDDSLSDVVRLFPNVGVGSSSNSPPASF